ncbi:hypothetical protein L1049_009389 [Liquidambar formosana]|uniref:DUF4283 domain-containing protein n=1 Tax=Liquidambar formosana TaxID=63359 RepID=A0AAP0S506_LIQFO
MAKRLIPSLNRVLVEKILPPSKTNAGIFLPEKTSKLNSGKVIAVGPGVHNKEGKLIPVSVKEGETVLLPEYGGTEVKLSDKEARIELQITERGRGFSRQAMGYRGEGWAAISRPLHYWAEEYASTTKRSHLVATGGTGFKQKIQNTSLPLGGGCSLKDDGERVFLMPEQKGIEERKLYLKRCLLGRFRDEAGSQEDIAKWATRVWKVPFGVKLSYLYDSVLLFLLPSEGEAHRVLISGNILTFQSGRH